MDDKTIIYDTYINLYDATYRQGILIDKGIECFISEDSMLPLNPIFSTENWGFKLHIFEKDFDVVKQILENI